MMPKVFMQPPMCRKPGGVAGVGFLWVIVTAIIMFILSGCSHGDDVNSLKDMVTTLEDAVGKLQEAYNQGKTISCVIPVTQDEGGYLVSFSDGTSLILKHSSEGQTDHKEQKGVTPMIKIDFDGYWVVSYDGGTIYSRIYDKEGDKGDTGLSVKVVIIDGKYVYRFYSPDDQNTVIESVYTPYISNSVSVLQSIVEDQENRVITLTMADGTPFRFNLDVTYPTSIILLSNHLDIVREDGTAEFEFRIDPSDSFVNFVYDGPEPNIRLAMIDKSGTDNAASYVTEPTDYRITDISPSYNEKGERKIGQYTVTVSSNAEDEDGEETVALILTTKDGYGNRLQLSSTLMTVSRGIHPQIYGINVGGIEAVKRDENTFYVKLPYGTVTNGLTAQIDSNSDLSLGENNVTETLDLSNPVKIIATLNGVSREYCLIAHYSDLPIVYVNTPSPVVNKEDWVKKSTIQIANAGEFSAIYEAANIRGRGNSTWGYPKKPYAIKLDKKAEVLGMPKHKRWCLLANWMDRTDMRNDIAFEIGRRMSGLAWTPRGRFVDLVFNGKFVGNYYLCEQIKVDSNRVNITEMSESDIEGDALTGGYLLELDTYFDEVNKFKSKIFRLPVMFKDPDEEVLQPAQFEYFQNYFNTVEEKLNNHDSYSEIAALIDIDSFIDWWLLNELVINEEPNHPKSSYMYKVRDGKLFAGPAWDYDWGTFCDPSESGWCIKKAIWYRYLFTYPEFVEDVKKRWQVNKNYLNSIPEYIDTLENSISESGQYDCQLWPINQLINGDENLSFHESVIRLKNNYIKRFNWIDENISKL